MCFYEFSTKGTLLYFFIFFIGTCIGSFLNVVIYRWSENLSLLTPYFSFCPNCKNPLKWYHNIPIISYVFLRGKCAYCKSSISIRYPIVEFLAGLLTLLLFIKFSFRWLTFFYFSIFFYILIAISFIDFKAKEIPDKLSLSLIFLGFIGSLLGLNPYLTMEKSLLSGLSGIGLMFLINEVYYQFTKRDGLGMGDFKLMGGIGSFLGYDSFYFILLIASFLGIAFFLGSLLWVRKTKKLQTKIDLKTEIPFGPMLSFAAMTYLFLLPSI